MLRQAHEFFQDCLEGPDSQDCRVAQSGAGRMTHCLLICTLDTGSSPPEMGAFHLPPQRRPPLPNVSEQWRFHWRCSHGDGCVGHYAANCPISTFLSYSGSLPICPLARKPSFFIFQNHFRGLLDPWYLAHFNSQGAHQNCFSAQKLPPSE